MIHRVMSALSGSGMSSVCGMSLVGVTGRQWL